MKNMKKIFLLLISVITLCACEGPMGPMGPMGPQGPAGQGVEWKIADIQITNWDRTNMEDNNYFLSRYSVPALTMYVYDAGNVNAYVYVTLEDGREVQHPLPYVYHMEYLDSEGYWNFYTRTISFVYGVGFVQFEVRDSNFMYEDDKSIVPEAMDFRVVMTY